MVATAATTGADAERARIPLDLRDRRVGWRHVPHPPGASPSPIVTPATASSASVTYRRMTRAEPRTASSHVLGSRHPGVMREDDHLRARLHVKFAQDVRDMEFDRADRYEQPVGDLAVTHSRDH